MRRVRMNRSVAGRRTTWTRGDEVDVTDLIAASMTAAGHAVDITPDGYEPDPTPDGDPPAPSGDETPPDLAALKGDELRALAEDRGLPTAGTKAELIDRLTTPHDDPDTSTDDDVPPAGGDDAPPAPSGDETPPDADD